jgi:hypothetical protein
VWVEVCWHPAAVGENAPGGLMLPLITGVVTFSAWVTKNAATVAATSPPKAH